MVMCMVVVSPICIFIEADYFDESPSKQVLGDFN